MTNPMSGAYCTTPMGDAYCHMPPAVARPTAAHTSTAGVGDLGMAGFTAVLVVAVLAGRWKWREKWATR